MTRTTTTTDIGRTLRQRREMLGLTIRQASRRTGVCHTTICEIERGRRMPSARTFQRLHDGLGASPAVLVRPAEPADPQERQLCCLAACLFACNGRTRVATIAAALGMSATAVGEQLPLVVLRFTACGVALRTDTDIEEVWLESLPDVRPAVVALSRLAADRRLSELSTDALAVLAYIGGAGRRHASTLSASGARTAASSWDGS